MERLLILFLALALDLLLGEPPSAIHPVVWIGKTISLGEKLAPCVHKTFPLNKREKIKQLSYGVCLVLLTVSLFSTATYFALHYLRELSSLAYAVIGGLLLKTSFSFKELGRTALEMRELLANDSLGEARVKIAALVSRDATTLEKPQLVSATIESVAENLNDSIVAPLFYFLILGVPGAIAYRVANTLDAMIGYHGKYEYLGKAAARLDDVLNFVPARISGMLLVVAARLYRKDSRNAWRVLLRDHGKTESPNAGWPMSAMAGALKTRLEKVGYYSLGDINTPLTPILIDSGVKLVNVSFIVWALLCILTEVFRIVLTA